MDNIKDKRELSILGVFGGIYFLFTYALSRDIAVKDRVGALGNLVLLLALIAFQITVIVALFGVYQDTCGAVLCFRSSIGVTAMITAVGLYIWIYLYSNTLYRKHIGCREDCVQGGVLYLLDFLWNTGVDILIVYLTLLFCYQYADNPFALLGTVVAINFVAEIDEKLLDAIFARSSYQEFAATLPPPTEEVWGKVRAVARGFCWIIMVATLAGSIAWMVQVNSDAVSCYCYECCGDNPVCSDNADCWDILNWQDNTGYCPSGGVFDTPVPSRTGRNYSNEFCDWSYGTSGMCGGAPSKKTRCQEITEIMSRCFADTYIIRPRSAYFNDTLTCPYEPATDCYDNDPAIDCYTDVGCCSKDNCDGTCAVAIPDN